jgi:peptidoglycan/LPS O-acetylase OafA/YrhL
LKQRVDRMELLGCPPATNSAAPGTTSMYCSTPRESAHINMPARNASIDGLRGLLAAYVTLWHFLAPTAVFHYLPSAVLVVYCFFAMSAYVLTPTWRGDYLVFLVRRFLRLWPVFALCLIAAGLLSGAALAWTDFAFYPIVPREIVLEINGPMWSLHVEAWAMLAFPAIVWFGKSLTRVVVGMLIFIALGQFEQKLGNGAMFVLGSYLTRYPFNVAALNWRFPQWLGKISYSLYLTHWIVFKACDEWLPRGDHFVGLPLAIGVGYLVWVGAERPSIELSRTVGSMLTRAKMAIA